jgi:biopolymer transport protein ExbD
MNHEPRPLDALALGVLATALAAAGLALLLIPQRIAQRPASTGVMTLRLDRIGHLWLWNQPIRAAELPELLRRAAQRPVRLRLVPDGDVAWGSVQQLVSQLATTPLPLELQLP